MISGLTVGVVGGTVVAMLVLAVCVYAPLPRPRKYEVT